MACKYVPLSKEDTYELIIKAKDGDEDAKETIVKQNVGLVKNIALKFVNRGYELDDLMQIGFIGLIKAVNRFDTGFDVMFSTYAVPMIMGEIKRYIRDDGKIKVSRQLKSDIKNMMLLQEEFYNKHGDYPKISELADMMKIDKEELLEIMSAKDALSGMDSLDNPESPALFSEKSIFKSEESEEKRINMIFLKGAIGELKERERQVIVLRYFNDMTQSQIAEKLGISQVQVSRIEKRVLLELRGKIAE